MAHNTETDKIEFSPLVADIFTQMAKDTQWVTDRVEENLREQVVARSQDFVNLVDALYALNKKIDSLALSRLLESTWVAYESSTRSINPPQY